MSGFGCKLNSQLVAAGGGLLPRVVNGVEVATDNGVYFPEAANQWSALGIAAPRNLYTFQESSGNLMDQIGTLDLTKTTVGTGVFTYESALGGSFTRNGIKMGGTANLDGAQFAANDTGLNISESESFAVLAYVRNPTIAGFHAYQMWSFLQLGFRLYESNGNYYRLDAHINIDGGIAPDDDTLRPILCVVNRATNFTGFYTELEAIEGASDPGALGGNGAMFIGFNGTANATQDFTCGLAAVWHGADAELDETLLETLGWSLAY